MDRASGLSAARYLFSLLRPRYFGMGFFWACSMLTFRTSILFPSTADVELVSTTLIFFSFAFNIATLVALAYIERRNTGFVDRLPSWLFASLTIVGIVVLAASDSGGAAVLNFDFFMLGCALTGIGYGYFWAVWSQTYSKMHPDVTSTSIPLTFILTVTLYLAVPWISHMANLPVWALMIPLPVISAILLVRCKKKDSPDDVEIENDRGFAPAITSLQDLIAAAVIFSFLFGFMWESSVMVLGSVNDTHRIPSTISLLAAALLFGATTFGRRRWDINLLFEYGVPVIVIAFALFPIMFSTNATIVDSVMDAGYSVLEILAWIMVTTTSYDERVSGAITGSILRVSFLLFRLIGIVAAFFIYQLAAHSSISPALFSILAIVAIWVWLMLSHRKNPVNDTASTPHAANELIEGVADDYTDDDEPIRTVGQVFSEWAEASRKATAPPPSRAQADSPAASSPKAPLAGEDTEAASGKAAIAVGDESPSAVAGEAKARVGATQAAEPQAAAPRAAAPQVAAPRIEPAADASPAGPSPVAGILIDTAADLGSPTGTRDNAVPRDAGQPANEPSADEASAGEPHAPSYSVEELCAAVSREYGLSRREAELLPDLTMGRSASYIADAFFISENTVRTHIKHILAKTGADSKRAITDFVYEQGPQIIRREANGR